MARFTLALFALAAVLAVSMAQRCKMPQQWEARRISFDPNRRSYHNHTSQYRVYSRYAYDGDNLRKHSFEYASFGDNPDERLEILELFKERKAYVTNLQTRACKVYNIPSSDSFLRHDIPDSAAFEGYEIIGSYPDSLSLSQWRSSDSTFGYTEERYQTFTQDCVPVRDDRFANATGFHYEEFSDVTLGFHDPNIFIAPSGCQPA